MQSELWNQSNHSCVETPIGSFTQFLEHKRNSQKLPAFSMVQDVFIYLIFTDLETTGVSRKFSFFYTIASCTVPKTLAQK